MNTFLLNISSPDGNLFADQVTKITLRGVEGDLAVLAGHMPFITSVIPCDVHVTLPDDTVKTGRTQGGLLTVSHNTVTLLGSFHWL